MSLDEMLGDAARFVDKAMARGADQAEVALMRGASLDVEVEAGRLAGTSRSQSAGGSIRVLKDDRMGFAYFTRHDQAEAAMERALQQTRLAPRLPMPLPEPADASPVPAAWDDDVASLDPDVAIEKARELVDGVAVDATIAGGIGLSWGMEALANHNGVAVAERGTMMQAFTSLVLEDGNSNINAWESRSDPRGFNPGSVSATVSETVQDLRKPVAAEGGKADVIFLPAAGGELVMGLIEEAVNGDGAMRGKSFWSHDLGTQVAHEGLHVADAPRRADALVQTGHDGEGRVTSDVPILDGGRLATFLFDTRDGAKHEQAPTGHAVRDGFKSTPGTGTHHTVLEHDVTRPLDALIGDVDSGYLVESVLGAHTANGTTGDFSVTAPNVWRIQNGAIESACKEVAIGGNLPKLLRRLDGVSDAPKVSPSGRMPAVRFRDVTISA